jgi:hypothetical protein
VGPAIDARPLARSNSIDVPNRFNTIRTPTPITNGKVIVRIPAGIFFSLFITFNIRYSYFLIAKGIDMGRLEIPPEKWLASDPEKIGWLEQYLARKGIYSRPLNTSEIQTALLSSVYYLIRRPNGQKEFANLKAAWRRYKSDKKRGNQLVQVRLKPQVKQQLALLSKSTSVSETVERLVREEINFLKDRRAAINDAIKLEIDQRTESAMARLENTQKQIAHLEFQNTTLKAELDAAQTEISNILLIIAEFEIAAGVQAGDDLGLSSSDKHEALSKQTELLNYYTKRIKTAASLPPSLG